MRCRVLLLWTLLALLPLRGWAGAAMQFDTQPAQPSAPAMAAGGGCHDAMAAAHRTSGVDGTSAEPGERAHAGCTMCAVCHGASAFDAVGFVAAQGAASFALNTALPTPCSDSPADRLERPPRAARA